MEIKFTDRFNEILAFSGIKQKDLAEACNLTRQTITDFKKGKAYPSLVTLFLICKKLDVSSDYLLGLSDFF